MKRYGFIVNKQFAVNRKRNISTILGIVLSIILFTTVGYLQNYENKTYINNAIYGSGYYEAGFRDLSMDEVNSLRNNVYLKDISLFREVNNSSIMINDIEKKIYIYEMDDTGLKEYFKHRIQLEQGRLPENNKEVIIDEIGREILNKNIGDTIKIEDKTYTVVGFYNKGTNRYTYNIEIVSNIDKFNSIGNVNVLFNVNKDKNKLKTIYKIANDLGFEINTEYKYEKLIINRNLLYHYGEKIDDIYNNNLNGVEYSLYGVIIILTSILTYGAINVSIKERIEQFSILRCMGATPSKIRMLLIKEGILLTILSLIPGILLGQIVCFFIINNISGTMHWANTMDTSFVIQVDLIIKVIILTIINIVIANIIPIIKIGKISPIEGIGTGGITEKTIKRKKSKIIRKFFGYNGELAYRNIRANNVNFIISTTISIIILTTFIVFTGYKSSVMNEADNELKRVNDTTINIYYGRENQNKDYNEELNRYKKEIEDLNIAEKIFPRTNYSVAGVFQDVTLNKWITEDVINYEGIEKEITINGQKGFYSSDINIIIMEDESLEEIIRMQKLGITLDDFNDNGVLITNRIALKNYINVERVPIFNLQEGEKFTLSLNRNNYIEEDENINIEAEDINNASKEVSFKYLGAINGRQVFDLSRVGVDNYVTLIVSKDFYHSNKALFLAPGEEEVPYITPDTISISIDFNENIKRDDAITTIENYTNKNEIDYIDSKKSEIYLKNNLKVISSVTYIVLFMTIIVGAVNIINNKYINIKLRGKEIGTLLALGINKRRLKKILMLEGIIQWSISSITSIGLSIIILKILYKILSFTSDIKSYEMPILAMIVGVVMLFIINVIGVYLPIRKLKYSDTTELIRNEE